MEDWILYLVYAGIAIGLFILMRYVWLWYFRIDERIKNQLEIIRLLKLLINQKELENDKKAEK